MGLSESERDADIASVYDEIAAITRRANARSRTMTAPLTFVEHSLVTFIGANPGCRATDIAQAFQLNRSTISRQVSQLTELGLVAHQPEDPGSRGQLLLLTDKGRALLAHSVDVQREALSERFQGWSRGDIAEFASALRRFNGTQDT